MPLLASNFVVGISDFEISDRLNDQFRLIPLNKLPALFGDAILHALTEQRGRIMPCGFDLPNPYNPDSLYKSP